MRIALEFVDCERAFHNISLRMAATNDLFQSTAIDMQIISCSQTPALFLSLAFPLLDAS
jgi:hypothetical protein